MIRTSAAALAAVVVVGGLAHAQHAAPPAREAATRDERSDGDRAWHAAPVAAGGVVYLLLEFAFKDEVTPDECRWCSTNPIDRRIRSALVWDDVEAAEQWSTLTSYVGGPGLAIGVLLATTADDPDLRRWFDDAIPVIQAGIVTGMVNQLVKVIAGRERPYSAFGNVSARPDGDENTSFFSGHSALSFAMTTASGTVASLRGYRSAPLLWIGGSALAVATGYLRIASDTHYASDAIVGSLVGGSIGIAVPWLIHRHHLSGGTTVLPHVARSHDGAIVSLTGAF